MIRSPDMTRATKACLVKAVKNPLLTSTSAVGKDDFVDLFGAAPGGLLMVGVNQCKKVGEFLHRRYIDEEKFLHSDYSGYAAETQFIARGNVISFWISC